MAVNMGSTAIGALSNATTAKKYSLTMLEPGTSSYKMKTSYDAHSSAFGYKSLAEEGGQALGSDTIAKKVALRSDYQQKHKEITVLL